MERLPIERNLPERLCYERPEYTLPPGVNLVGRFRCRGVTQLPRHAHAGVFELCLVARGVMRYSYEGHEVDIGADEVHLCRPGVVHAGVNNLLDPCLLYWCEFDPVALLPAGPGLEFFQRAASGKLPGPVSGRLRDRFEALLETCGRPPSAERDAEIQWRLGLMLLEVARTGKHSETCVRYFSPPVASLIRAFRADPSGRRPLRELVAETGLASSALYERFRHETGFSPHEYRMQLKVELARELLCTTGAAVTEIAYRCGFSSSQYFATVFGRLTGVTPGRWRREHANGKKSTVSAT